MKRSHQLALAALVLVAAFAAERFGLIDLSETGGQTQTAGEAGSSQTAGVVVPSLTADRTQASALGDAQQVTVRETTIRDGQPRQPRQEQQATIRDGLERGCGVNVGLDHPERDDLIAFARASGLRNAAAFAGTAISIHETGRLPDCYLTKRDARERGWSPGTSVWVAGQGRQIGGDRFGNREGRLPDRYTGRYIEADLDYDGARGRNAKRLVFVANSRGDWLQWLTVDHYDSFTQVRP